MGTRHVIPDLARLSLRKLAPRRGHCQHCAVRPERLDAELISVDLARRRRRGGKAGGESAARHRRMPAVSDRAAAVMKTRHVEVRHRELQPRRSLWHVREREARRAGAKDAEKAKASDMVSKSAKPAMPSAAAFWCERRLIMDDSPRRNGHSRSD
jgi:hypothetical protein